MTTMTPIQQRSAIVPSVTATVLVTLFFGLFGLIPAIMHSNRARAMAQPTGKYWKAFWVTLIASFIAWILMFAALAGAMASV